MLRQCLAISGLCLEVLLASHAEAASNVVQYSYDAAGNIVAIQRLNPAPIALAGFSPASGPSGTTVTITGTGFSATATLNAVSFNGLLAAVVAASPTSLTVTVPANATTGKVAVTVAGNTIASAQDFVITAPGAPTIASFTPTWGAAGTVVTISGTNFNPASGATTVKLNKNPAALSSVTPTTLAFTVPSGTASGRILVSTAAGSGSSGVDFIVPPAGVAAADILATTRLAVDGPAGSIGLYSTNKYGLVLFDGTAGAWMSLQVANFTITPAGSTIAYTIYKPDNTQLATGSLSAANLSIHLPALPMGGTYSVLLRTGLAQLSLDAKLESNRFLPTDSASVEFARSAGQSTRALIAGVAGEQKAFMVSGFATTPVNGTLDVQILLPSGSTFRRTNALGLGTTTPLPPFTIGGTYSVILTPAAATTQSGYKVALLRGSMLEVDGPASDVVIANPGEAARLTFAGVAGENLGLGVSGVALNPATSASVSVAAYTPNGLSMLISTVCAADGTRCAANLENLPVTGIYTVIVQPVNGQTGTQRVWLSRDVGGKLVNGVPLTVALTRPGHNARLTLTATAGSLLALQVRGVTTAPMGQGLLAIIYQPDRAWLAYTHWTGAGQTLVTPPLPVTGTYTVFIEPEPAAQAAATATMEVLVDPGRTLDVDGPTQSVAIGAAGGSARFVFSATAGQNLGVGVHGLALVPSTDAVASIYKPDGTPLVAYSCTATSGGCGGGNLLNVPATGTYGIVVRPVAGATGSVSATLSSDLAGSVVAGGAPFVLNLERPGRNARLTFAGIAGQTLRLSWSSVSSVASYTYLTFVSPGGSTLALTSVLSSGTSIYDLPALPVAGNYTLLVDPPAPVTLNATVRITPR